MLQAARRAEPGCRYYVDCEPCVSAAKKGIAAARSDKNPLARVHTMMVWARYDTPPEDIVWIPSHCTEKDIGTATRGDGFLLQLRDLRGNEAADKYAKRAVETHRVPYRIRQEIKAHDRLTVQNAVWVARATTLANQQSTFPQRDSQASREKALAAARERRRQAAMQGDTTSAKRKTDVKLRPVADGGHQLEQSGRFWECKTCKIRSLKWSRLAPQECGGSVVQKWLDTAWRRT